MATTKVKHYVLDEAEHDPNDPNPWIVGYARMSDGEHVDAPEVQAMKIRERSETIKGRYVGTWVDGGVSGRGVPYDKRPGFVDCLAVVRKGDHLVVNKLDRLERGGLLRLTRCLGAIADKDVYLHSIHENGGERLDFSKLEMQPVIFMLAWAAEFYSQQQIETLRATREWRKKNGYAICGRQLGRRVEKVPDPAHAGKKLKLVVWDEKECRQMREIYCRHVLLSEPMSSIAADYVKREERTCDDKQWVPLRSWEIGKRKRPNRNYSRLHKACEHVQEWIEAADPAHPGLAGWDGTLKGFSGKYTPPGSKGREKEKP